MARRDAIVIGAGLNGLTAAAYLARAGLDVLVLDRGSSIGGVAVAHEIAPGFSLPRFALGSGGIPASIVADLDLTRHGLRFTRVEGGVTMFDGGRHHASYRDGTVHRREIARFSRRDADAWTRYRRDMLRAVRALNPLLASPVTVPAGRSFAALKRRLGFADRMAEIATDDLHEIVRLWSLSAAGLLDTYFESGIVKAHLAAAAMMGGTLGPLSPSGASRLLTPWLDCDEDATGGAPGVLLPLGGPAALTSALASVVEAHGGQIRIEAEVTDVLMKDRTVRGVVLANGEEILAPAVLSDLDVKRSFLGLFQWKDLPEGLVESIGRFRMKGVVAKVNLALDGAPEFPALAAGCPAVAGGLRLAGSVERMEEAFDDWRDGIPPRDPLIEVLMPSLSDPTLAPAGKHVLSAVVQYVPETLHEGAWCAERRNALGDLVVSRLAEVSPDIGARIVAREIWLPADIEAEIGLTSGDFSHGEMTLDQMFFNRPLAGMGGYDTPVRNFYLCSESAHPGAMVPARSGANAAARVLAARKGRG